MGFTPSALPSALPSSTPSASPSAMPSSKPSAVPSSSPSVTPSEMPSLKVSVTLKPTNNPANETAYTVTIQESVRMKNLALSDLDPAELKNGLESVLAHLGCGFNPATVLIEECTAKVMKINGENLNSHVKDRRLLQRKLQTPTLRIEYELTFEAVCGTRCNDVAAVQSFKDDVYILATGVVKASVVHDGHTYVLIAD